MSSPERMMGRAASLAKDRDRYKAALERIGNAIIETGHGITNTELLRIVTDALRPADKASAGDA